MSGARFSPTTSKYHHHGSGFHGSPVEPSTNNGERSCRFTGSSPARIRPRMAVAEMRYPMSLDDRPYPAGIRIIGRAVVQQDCGAVDEAAGDEPGPHHPADVR